MDVVTENVNYSSLIRPFRHGVCWLGTSLAITVPIALLFLQSDIVDFVFVCLFGVLPVSVLAFVSPWSRARQLRKKSHAIFLSSTQLTVDETSHELRDCRWFRGWAFHQPEFSQYPVYMPAVVVSWPPYSDESRAICGLDADRREEIIDRLLSSSAVEDRPRKRNERLVVTSSGVVGAAVVLTCLVTISSFREQAIPFPSIAISAIAGGIFCRIAAKHSLGHIQFQEPPSKQSMALLLVVVVGTLRLNRRNGGGPLHQNPSLLLWVLPLAAIQIGSLTALYIWVRKREIERLGPQALAAKPHS